jgi:hypothetical protein
VNGGMERLDPAIQQLGKAGDLAHLYDGNLGGS